MESFPVDIDPEQVVRWVMAEHNTAPSSFKTIARRVTEVREIPSQNEYRFGDDERDELSEVATIATLEIIPTHEHDGWLLTVTVEDELGPRAAADGGAPEAEQQIDLGTFYNEFIRPGRGIANVVAQTDGETARLHVTRLLEAIERNRHAIMPKGAAS